MGVMSPRPAHLLPAMTPDDLLDAAFAQRREDLLVLPP